jgi:pimeloyl-ACP methyl ester carboxylesterase
MWARRIFLAILAFVTVPLALGVAFEQWSRWHAFRTFSPPGTVIDVDGKRFHLHCEGEGEPTVILEAGLSIGGSQDWVKVQPEIARLTRVCSYDRAGILWSESRRERRDAFRLASDLHALLSAASETPPYVMVGHSLGGLFIRVFASRFEEEVVGFVFVDPSHPEQDERLPRTDSTRPEPPPPLLWRFRAATGIYRLRAKPANYGLPSGISKVVESFRPKTVAELAREEAAMGETMRQASETGLFSDRPLVVLTAALHGKPGMNQAQIREFQDTAVVLHAEVASLSTNSDHRIIEHAHHYIQLDTPQAVVRAITDVVSAVRGKSPLGPGEDQE